MMHLIATQEELEPEAPLEAIAMVRISAAKTYGELSEGLELYHVAMEAKFRRIREIDAELNSRSGGE